MPRDYLEEPYAAVRRKDRAVDDDAWIVELLRRAPMAQLATVHDGQPFINSNLFAYDEAAHVVYMHTATAGRTRSNVEADERACVSVSEMGRLLPSREALSMSVEYGGVAIFGRARIVSDDTEKEEMKNFVASRLRVPCLVWPEIALWHLDKCVCQRWIVTAKAGGVDYDCFRYSDTGSSARCIMRCRLRWREEEEMQ